MGGISWPVESLIHTRTEICVPTGTSNRHSELAASSCTTTVEVDTAVGAIVADCGTGKVSRIYLWGRRQTHLHWAPSVLGLAKTLQDLVAERLLFWLSQVEAPEAFDLCDG